MRSPCEPVPPRNRRFRCHHGEVGLLGEAWASVALNARQIIRNPDVEAGLKRSCGRFACWSCRRRALGAPRSCRPRCVAEASSVAAHMSMTRRTRCVGEYAGELTGVCQGSSVAGGVARVDGGRTDRVGASRVLRLGHHRRNCGSPGNVGRHREFRLRFPHPMDHQRSLQRAPRRNRCNGAYGPDLGTSFADPLARSDPMGFV